MAKYYSKKDRFKAGLKECRLFKATATGSRLGFICVITCVYKRQVIHRKKSYGHKIKLGGVYNGWSISFHYIKIK